MKTFLIRYWFALALVGVALFFLWRLRALFAGAPAVKRAAGGNPESIAGWITTPLRGEHETLNGQNVVGAYGLDYS